MAENVSIQHDCLPVAALSRGPIVESLHSGAIAVVDAAGNLLAGYGNPNMVTFLRSTSKPLQAISFVEDGGMEAFGISEAELSLMCASHSGSDNHASTAASIQGKAGVSEMDLLCGVHAPLDKNAHKSLILNGEKPTPNRHQCSGKHSGMLANCQLHGFSIKDYILPEHPLQKLILSVNADMWQVAEKEVLIGIDGCSVPVFAIPLWNAALGYARLVDPAGLAEPRVTACRRITSAMMAHPEMVAGQGWFDTELMRVGKGKWVTKMGAEGFQSIGILPNRNIEPSRGIGIAIKIQDGDQRGKIASLVAVEVLRQMGFLSQEEIKALANFHGRPLYNWRGFEIGRIYPVFKLERYV